jgi:hypothetical protein
MIVKIAGVCVLNVAMPDRRRLFQGDLHGRDGYNRDTKVITVF